MCDLPGTEIMEGHKPDSSVQGHADLDRQKGLQRTDGVILSDTESSDDLPERFYPLRRPQIISADRAPSKTGHNEPTTDPSSRKPSAPTSFFLG